MLPFLQPQHQWLSFRHTLRFLPPFSLRNLWRIISGWAECVCVYKKEIPLRLQRACVFILLSNVTEGKLTVPAPVFVCTCVFLRIQRMRSCLFVSVESNCCRKILRQGRPGSRQTTSTTGMELVSGLEVKLF